MSYLLGTISGKAMADTLATSQMCIHCMYLLQTPTRRQSSTDRRESPDLMTQELAEMF